MLPWTIALCPAYYRTAVSRPLFLIATWIDGRLHTGLRPPFDPFFKLQLHVGKQDSWKNTDTSASLGSDKPKETSQHWYYTEFTTGPVSSLKRWLPGIEPGTSTNRVVALTAELQPLVHRVNFCSISGVYSSLIAIIRSSACTALMPIYSSHSLVWLLITIFYREQ